MAKQLTGRQKSEARRQITITNPSVCYFCKSTGLTAEDKFCPNCGFPQKGSQPAMKRFIWNVKNKHILLADHKKAVNKARYILFILSILFFIISMFGGLFQFDILLLISGLVLAGVYLGLGFWSRKSPFPAILTGFFLYVTTLVMQAVNDPSKIFHGVLFKSFIIGGLFYGYKGVKDAMKLEKELESIKKAKDLKISDEVQQMSV